MGNWFSSDDQENQTLKQIIANHEKEITRLREEIEEMRNGEPARKHPVRTLVSYEKILKIVDEQMKTNNIPYFPDSVERLLKAQMMQLVLGAADDILESMRFEIYGHEVPFDLVPIRKKTFRD